jgi:hypothetical protein
MLISKAGRLISSLADWERYAGPKGSIQWVDGRSAKELARVWLDGESQSFPAEVISIIENSDCFGPVISWNAEPEAQLRFDSFAGEPRNSDLAVYAHDSFGPYLLAIEGKADESYGDTIAKTLVAAKRRLQKNPRSNGVRRIEQLVNALFGKDLGDFPEMSLLRYQLLTACAGALAEAERRGFERTIMLVHEFVTTKTQDRFHVRNSEDLSAFVRVLSRQPGLNVMPDVLYGPFNVAGGGLFQNKVKLFIGKVSRNIRG